MKYRREIGKGLLYSGLLHSLLVVVLALFALSSSSLQQDYVIEVAFAAATPAPVVSDLQIPAGVSRPAASPQQPQTRPLVDNKKLTLRQAKPVEQQPPSSSSTGAGGNDISSSPAFAPPSTAGIINPKPRYPELARRYGLQGTVFVVVLVDNSGRSAEASIHRSSGYAMLDSAALNAVKDWRFNPATDHGEPVMASLIVPIEFRLTDARS